MTASEPAVAVPIIDLRSEQQPDDGRTKLRNGRTVMRDPVGITGVVLHQTACVFDVSDRAVARAGGDRRLALGRRVVRGVGMSPGVPAHAIAMREGFVVRAFDLAAYCYHAHGLNSFTLGLEIEGLYSGLLDDPATLPNEQRITTPGRIGVRDDFDALTIAAAKAALRFLVEQGRREGMPLAFLYAHRQSSSTRRADPGAEIWSVLEPYAISLGLEPRWTYVTGDGRPVPREWSARGLGRY